MSAWARFWLVLGILWGVFLSGVCVGQGWHAVDVTGAVVFTLPKADSLRLLRDGTVLCREGTTWYLRRSRDGEILAGPVLPEPRFCRFGTLYPTLNSTQVGIPAGGGKAIAGASLADAGYGWVREGGTGSGKTLYSREGKTVVCPPGTDSTWAVTAHHLIYISRGKAGLIRFVGEEAHVVLPAVYDSLSGPNQGYVLAFDRSQAQLYDETGKPVYKGAFTQARFVNRHWLAGKTNGGWQAVHLPSLKLYPSAEQPRALGLGHCLLSKGSQSRVLDSTGKLVAENLESTLTQTGTDRLVVRRAGKWYLLSEEGTASVHLKTPHLQRMEPFMDGLAPVCTQAGLWGFADGSGFMRIAPRYRGCTAFELGLAGVQIGPYWGLIDKAERLVSQPHFDSVRAFVQARVWVCYGSHLTEVWHQGQLVGKYLDVRPADNNLIVRESTGWGLVSPTGTSLIPPWYSSLVLTHSGLLLARRGDEWAVLTPTHQTLLPWKRRRILQDSAAGIFFVERGSASAND